MTKEDYMRLALREARRAAARDEVPVGAVVVREEKVVSSGHNRREKRQDATAHAELLAIRRACKKLKSWRLTGCELYVTLEPCPMCAGAAVNARMDGVYFGAPDPNGGACGSVYSVCGDAVLNHVCPAEGNILGEECAQLLRDYFRAKRKSK